MDRKDNSGWTLLAAVVICALMSHMMYRSGWEAGFNEGFQAGVETERLIGR